MLAEPEVAGASDYHLIHHRLTSGLGHPSTSEEAFIWRGRPSVPRCTPARQKTDVSVDSVKTLFGTTKCLAARLITREEPRTKVLNQNRRGHVVPVNPDHELVLDTHVQPTEPERGAAQTQPQQAEGPPARDLNPPPHNLTTPRATAPTPERKLPRPGGIDAGDEVFVPGAGPPSCTPSPNPADGPPSQNDAQTQKAAKTQHHHYCAGTYAATQGSTEEPHSHPPHRHEGLSL